MNAEHSQLELTPPTFEAVAMAMYVALRDAPCTCRKQTVNSQERVTIECRRCVARHDYEEHWKTP